MGASKIFVFALVRVAGWVLQRFFVLLSFESRVGCKEHVFLFLLLFESRVGCWKVFCFFSRSSRGLGAGKLFLGALVRVCVECLFLRHRGPVPYGCCGLGAGKFFVYRSSRGLGAKQFFCTHSLYIYIHTYGKTYVHRVPDDEAQVWLDALIFTGKEAKVKTCHDARFAPHVGANGDAR